MHDRLKTGKRLSDKSSPHNFSRNRRVNTSILVHIAVMSNSGFYELSEADRIAVTEAAIARRQTVVSRWTALATDEAEPWSARSAEAAKWLQGAKTVLDVGCGTMGLERYLDAHYIPSDVVRRDDRTIVMDYNQEGPPLIAVDAVAVLGVLEYLHDPGSFLAGLRARKAVISYCVTDAKAPLTPRRAHAWVNDLSTLDVVNMLQASGWTIQSHKPIDDIQTLWLAAK